MGPKIKKVLLTALILGLALLPVPYSASASTVGVDISYTGDNVVFWLMQQGDEQAVLLPDGPNAIDWRWADTAHFELQRGVSYTFYWWVLNAPDPNIDAPNNPSGFLGQVVFSSGQPTLLSSDSWLVSSDTQNWIPGQVYADNSGNWLDEAARQAFQAANPGVTESIWWYWKDYTTGSGQIDGISGQAAWIGLGPYVEGNDFWVKLEFTVPVPIPGAIWLLGSGLIGLMGLRRKFMS
ncbi:MAG: VPLPA-CTERM sorting domain-containing protein [Thermodesulfobacteriota bacterium]